MLSILSLEFYLVAGGEEILLETGMLGLVKVEDSCDMLLDSDENDIPSSQSASPNVSPSVHLDAESPPSPTAILSTNSNSSSALFRQKSSSNGIDSALPVGLSFHTNTDSQQSHSLFRSTASPFDNSSPPALSGPAIPSPRGTRSYKPGPETHCQPAVSNQPRSVDASLPHTSGVNRVKTICLLADGMTPFSVHVDALSPSQSRRAWLALKMKLCITSVDDLRSPPTLHGFAASVCLSGAWTNSAKCITKVYAGNVCISEEVGTLGLSNIELGQVTAIFPDSSLTRCRWLDACG